MKIKHIIYFFLTQKSNFIRKIAFLILGKTRDLIRRYSSTIPNDADRLSA